MVRLPEPYFLRLTKDIVMWLFIGILILLAQIQHREVQELMAVVSELASLSNEQAKTSKRMAQMWDQQADLNDVLIARLHPSGHPSATVVPSSGKEIVNGVRLR